MPALVKRRSEPGLWLEEVPVPEVGIDDVLIRVLKNSICGTDVHIYNWDDWARKTIPVPMVVGARVRRAHRVGRQPRARLSTRARSSRARGTSCAATAATAWRAAATFARTPAASASTGPGRSRSTSPSRSTNVWHCDPNIPLEVLSCFDPLGNAVHTALSFDVLGEDVLITGAGPIGCMAAAVARHAGARYVVVTDVNPYRLDLATKLGATHAVDVSKESLADLQTRSA